MTTTQAETTIPTGVWKSDAVHSHAGFAVKHTAATFQGDFGQFEAVLSNDPTNEDINENGEPRLRGSVEVESVNVRDENLEAHLLSPEFFDAERTPKIGFESTSMRIDGDELIVEGELTVSGHKQPVTARGTVTGPTPGPADTERLGVELETKVDRHDYGLDWNMELPDGGQVLGDEVTISAHLELVKES